MEEKEQGPCGNATTTLAITDTKAVTSVRSTPPRGPMVGLVEEELSLPVVETRGATRSAHCVEPTSHLSSSHSSTSASPCSPSSSSATSCPSSVAARSSLRRRPHFASPSLSLNRDDRLLQRALADAGRGAYGIGLVEVWVLDGTTTTTGTHLSRPPAGFWTDPVLHRHSPGGGGGNSNACPLCRLVDPCRRDYVSPRPLAPGEGLPGALWSQVSPTSSTGPTAAAAPPTHWTRSFRETLAHRILHHPPPSTPPPPPATLPHTTTAAALPDLTLYQMLSHYLYHPHQTGSGIAWEYLPQLQSDPDQPWNPRLQVLARAGLGWVAGVPFSFHDAASTPASSSSGALRRGLVLYAARHTADRTRLRSPIHESYLVSATQLVAFTYALRGPRHEVAKLNGSAELDRAWRQVRHRIVARHRAGIPLPRRGENSVPVSIPMALSSFKTQPDSTSDSSPTATPMSSSRATIERFLGRRLTTALAKARGGGAPVPPSFTWSQSLLTFFGCFGTLWIVTATSEALSQRWGPDHAIIVGPFGAFVTLLYGLTAAPASQPRNALLGQTVSMLVAMALSRAAASGPLLLVRQSFAAALAIAAMVKGGITHPPAGASALLVASGQFGWTNVAWTLVGNVVAIVAATLINNLSHQRQYPMYWWGIECTPPSFWKNSDRPNNSSPTTTTTTTHGALLRQRLHPRDKGTYDEEISV